MAASRHGVVIPFPSNRANARSSRTTSGRGEVLLVDRARWGHRRRAPNAAATFASLVRESDPADDLQRRMILAAVACATLIVAFLQLSAS